MAVFSASRSVVDLAIDPLITCKLCLAECTLQEMYELQDCRCIYCLPVSILCHTLGTGTFFGIGNHYYRPQRSCGKVMFLHPSVILSTGGVWQTPPRQTPPPADPPPGRHPTLGRHPRADRRPLQRTVRILLESILVLM